MNKKGILNQLTNNRPFLGGSRISVSPIKADLMRNSVQKRLPAKHILAIKARIVKRGMLPFGFEPKSQT